MAKRRTKSQKRRTEIKRAEGGLAGVVYKFDKKELDDLGGQVGQSVRVKVDESPVELLNYEAGLLKKDLIKTLVLSMLMFMTVVGVYVYSNFL